MSTFELVEYHANHTVIPRTVLVAAIPKAIDAVHAARDAGGSMHDAGAAAAVAALEAAFCGDPERAFATAPSLEAPAGAGVQEAPLVHEEDQQEQGQVVGHAQDDESGGDLARMLAGAIRSTLSSLPFQAPEAIGSLVSMKLGGALAEYERQVAASDQDREPRR